MCYHGYIPFMKAFLERIPEPNVIEIGVDKGQTLIPLVVHLTRLGKPFSVTGIDIKIMDHLPVIISNLEPRRGDQNVSLVQDNSLRVIPTMTGKFDLILVDGDHNYTTVMEELRSLSKLTLDSSIIVCDDYFGRWSDKDLFYYDRDPDVRNIASVPADLRNDSKQGVRTAIDDFLKESPEWSWVKLMEGEPVVLHKGFWKF